MDTETIEKEHFENYSFDPDNFRFSFASDDNSIKANKVR